jgi:tetratricopeptide (TPR) repeat protein
MRESNPTSETTAHPELDHLKQQWHQAVEAGRLEEALALLDRAAAFAGELDDPRLIDLVICDRAAVAIELGQGAKEIPQLREILLRNADPANCRVAAYNIARHYELSRDYKKALFYARIARDRSDLLGRRDWLASSCNLMGNTLLADSLVEQATEQYERALELTPDGPSVARGMVLDNLGYCRMLQGNYAEAYRLLYQSLRLFRRVGHRAYQIPPRLDLCFLHIETGRYEDALRHGLRALELAEALGQPDFVKNALYLVGVVENLRGNVDAARAHFRRLQQEFFPEASYLPGFLLAVDVRKLVNLHA